MNNIKIMTIEQKEKNEDGLYYCYSVNRTDVNTDSDGIIMIRSDVFDTLPAVISDYTLYAMNLFLDKKISIIRPSQDPMILPDCSDLYGIIAFGKIIEHYKKTNKVPKIACILSAEVVDMIMQSDEHVQFFIDNGIMSREEVESYREENDTKADK